MSSTTGVSMQWSGANIAFGRFVAALLLPCFLIACKGFESNKLDKVKASGELVVLVCPGPSTYVETADGPSGFDYDMIKAFADSLDINVKFVAISNSDDLLPTLAQGSADMAADIAVTDVIRERFLVTPSYQQVREQVVYRQGAAVPQNVDDLVGRQIEVQSGTHHATRLRELQQSHKKLKWKEVDDSDTQALLELVWEGLLDITVSDSHIIALNHQFFPELQVAFDLSPPRSMVWAFPLVEDQSLYDAASQFMERYRRAGELARLLDRYYGPATQASTVNLTVYHARIGNRLPLFQQFFEKAGHEVNLDWRLLAAMAYQESYWDPKAVSPTGVRGLMMLTEETAKQMGVGDLLDPLQSILGGSHYLKNVYDRLSYIALPDRTWFALAAYNVGLQHLEDARILAQHQGKDPNKWSDVKEYLPLLEQPRWYNRTRFGFARGSEPVLFVNRVRTYYDVLVKQDDEERAKARTGALKLKVPAI